MSCIKEITIELGQNKKISLNFDEMEKVAQALNDLKNLGEEKHPIISYTPVSATKAYGSW